MNARSYASLLAIGLALVGCGKESDTPTPGLLTTPGALTTTEGGGTATFTVALRTAPAAAVTVALTSSDPGEVAVGTPSLDFDAGNWSIPQNVTLVGVDDDVADGAQPASVTLTPSSADPKYDAVATPGVVAVKTASNSDDDAIELRLSRTAFATVEGGAAETFTVRLGSVPSTGTVTVALTSSDPTEWTVAPGTLTFTTSDWATPKTATVTPVDDFVQDGAATGYVRLTTTADDAAYAALVPVDVSLSNEDDDFPGYTVSVSAVTTQEKAGNQAFTVRLNTAPSANVAFTVVSGDTSEGLVSPGTLTFTTSNWSTPQTVTIAPVHDYAVDGAQQYDVTLTPSSSDSDYGAMAPRTVAVTNNDADVAGFTLNKASLTTGEGSTGTFTVVLDTIPATPVTFSVVSLDTTEGTVSPASLSFNSANWYVPQTITVAGVHDFVDDDTVVYSITVTPTGGDANYTALQAKGVSVTSIDYDTAMLLVDAPNKVTGEPNVARTFTVALNTKPTANVTVGVTSNNTLEGTVSPASLTFTPDNWNAAQTVTVTGVDDKYVDGTVAYEVRLLPSSGDPKYSALGVTTLYFTNADDDVAGIEVSKASVTTAEAGTTDTFQVRLKAKPYDAISAHFTAGTSEITLDGVNAFGERTLAFTPSNWNTWQTVTVASVDDCYRDDTSSFTISSHTMGYGADAPFYNLPGPSIAVTSVDNEPLPAIVVSGTPVYVSWSDGFPASVTTGELTVKLNTCPRPYRYVTICTGGTLNWVTLSPSSIHLSSSNYSTGLKFTVTPFAEVWQPAAGVYPSTVSLAQCAGGLLYPDSPEYNGLTGPSASIVNTIMR